MQPGFCPLPGRQDGLSWFAPNQLNCQSGSTQLPKAAPTRHAWLSPSRISLHLRRVLSLDLLRHTLRLPLAKTKKMLCAHRRQPRPAATTATAATKGFAGAAAAKRKQQQLRRRQQQQQQQRRKPGQPSAAGDDGDDDGDDDGGQLGELSAARHVITVPDFSPVSRQLRGVFEERFRDPRATSEQRFLWDYWHVPDQYTLHRTQAAAYFPDDLHDALVDALLEFGEKQLGCRAISPIWMSYYTDGCSQELHCDSFHGPFAYVLSLTHWDARPFTGGETLLLQPQLLGGFWSWFSPAKGLELRDLVTLVEPRFNQLTVFDPRLPHGVRPVHGTRDPLQGRLVLHGWFTEPSPFFDGPLDEDAATAALNDALLPMFDTLAELPRVCGTTAARFRVHGGSGAVSDVEFLADTLVALPAAADAALGGGLLDAATVRGAVQHTIRDALLGAVFPASEGGGDTLVTLPLVFE